jgi:hypothetical protein
MALLHYTATESAFRIIESGVLHATHWRYLNDGSELSAIRPQLVKQFAAEFEQEGMELIKVGRMNPRLLENHGKQVFQLEAQKLFDIAYSVTHDFTPIFLTSLCRHESGSDQERDGLLSQWRGYGSGGGCALVFDEAKLQAMIHKEAADYACVHITMYDVNYTQHEQALKEIDVSGLAKAILQHLARFDIEKNKKIIDQRMHDLHVAISRVAPMLKHPAFSEEKETRIVLPCMNVEAAQEYPGRLVKEVHFRFREGLPVPYVKLFDGKQPLPITRVIVGPQRRQEDIKHTISLALKARGMSVTVDTSSIPLVL